MSNLNSMLTGRLHVHSENSIKDSASRVEDIAKKAAELSLDAVALTDHGNATGWQSFAESCRKNNVKPVCGVELYVVDNVNDLQSVANEKEEDVLDERSSERLHLILLGVDDIGRQAIRLLVTETNEHIVFSKDKKCTYPCADMKMIAKYMGEGALGHGHVIATSACDGGVLAGMSIRNDALKKELDFLAPEIERQILLAKKLPEYMAQKEEAEKTKKSASAVAKKKFTRQEALLAKKDSYSKEEYERMKTQLEAAKEETKKAAAELEEAEKTLRKLKPAIANCKANLVSDDELARMKTRCAFLKKEAVPEENLREKMKEKALAYDQIFGRGWFYIELEYHGAEREKKWMPVLYEIAKETGIPVMAANNEHLVEKKDFEKRRYLAPMKLKSFQYYPQDMSWEEKYFKSDKELWDALNEILPGCAVNSAFKGTSDIIARCDGCENLISDEKHYPKFDPSWSKEETQKALEEKARAGIPARYDVWTDELEKRLLYELGVIDGMGFEDYFLIVAWYIETGKLLGTMKQSAFLYLKENLLSMELYEIEEYIRLNQGGTGYAVGPGRGSGAGSIVCYLTGITAIDPIKYNLVFERFLNPERVSMPDIDSDFSKEIREVLIDIVRKKYGQNGVSTIMTRGTMGAKYAIQNCAKVYGSEREDDSKAFLDLADELSSYVPKLKGHVSDAKKVAEIKLPNNEDAARILDAAEGLEGTYIQTGKHAAGVVIADNRDIRAYTALLWDPEDETWKTQLDKDEVERNHLLKMDFLGLKYLDIITETLRLIKDRYPDVNIDPDKLPIEEDIIRSFAEADTDQVFQFESAGMKRMLKQFKPDKFEDIILLVAAYRPGPMQFLPDVFAVKNGKDPDYLTDKLKPILEDTYGQIIYQEQVMQIFQQLAGYSLGGADLVRRAMGHKELEKLQKERKAFIYGDEERGIKGCAANGIPADKADTLFSQMEKFAEYAFNKSHAAAYARISYITAYLKQRYTAEFMAAVIHINGNSDERKGVKKISGIVRDCKAHGVEVVCPDINISEAWPVTDGNTIYLGFSSIGGVAGAAEQIVNERKKNGAYTGPADFIMRTNAGKGIFDALISANAFRAFGVRSVLLKNEESLIRGVKDQAKALKDLEEKEAALKALDAGDLEEAKRLNGGAAPKRMVLERRIINARAKLASAKAQIDAPLNYGSDAGYELAILAKEKKVLGTYISASPLEGYEPVAMEDDHELADLSSKRKKVSILVFPENIEFGIGKKSGREYITFMSLTPLGEIKSFCNDSELMKQIREAKEPFIAKGDFSKDKRQEEEDGAATFFIKEAEAAKLVSNPLQIKTSNPEAVKGVMRENGDYTFSEGILTGCDTIFHMKGKTDLNGLSSISGECRIVNLN